VFLFDETITLVCGLVHKTTLTVTLSNHDLVISHALLFYAFSEIFDARVWNEDPRFQAPMTTLPCGSRLFVDDFISFHGGYGKVLKFKLEVWQPLAMT